MKLPILIAADGAAGEAALVLGLDQTDYGVTVVRRCVDIVELLAVAASGQARVALLAASLPRLDSDAIDRLEASDVIPVGLINRGDIDSETRLRALGVTFTVPADADPKIVAAVIEQAVAAADEPPVGAGGGASGGTAGSTTGAGRTDIIGKSGTSRDFSAPGGATLTITAPNDASEAPSSSALERRGSVLAVWGPTGAPGRTTVAVSVADELARLGSSVLLIDADVYGGVVGQVLGVLDESAGIAAACRQAAATRLDPAALAGLCWQVTPQLRVLTGIPRAERWPEVRPSALTSVIMTARAMADFIVVDCGFCIESDEELSFDSMAPRRNGATLAILDAADLVLIVGAADPLGLQRLARGLAELRDAEITATNWVVLNKVRDAVAAGDSGAELRAALDRFTGRVPAALLPFDQDGVDAATAAGKTLAEARPASPLRRAIRELAAGLAGVDVPAGRRHRRQRRAG